MIPSFMAPALIMAGGQSSRMRASLGRHHKGLVHVLGVSLLERNILTLLSYEVREIFVAVGIREKSVLAFVQGRGKQIAKAGGGELKVLVEKTPLGTIGAARAIETSSNDLLVVNVDNLTSLDLRALLDHHRATQAALTIATHMEPFQVPFGQVSVRDGEILDYKEKPIFQVPLCSGTYVLGQLARFSIPPNRPFGAPELVHLLLRAKHKVFAFSHCSPWIDVNDAGSVEKARELIRRNSELFELWRQPAKIETVNLCVLKRGRVALQKSQPFRATSKARIPEEDIRSQSDTPLRCVRRIQRGLGLTRVGKPMLLVAFDELDIRNAKRTRHHVFVAEMGQCPGRVRHPRCRELLWVRVADLVPGSRDRHGNSRIVAHLQRYVASQDSHSVNH
jgi:NDP-sugar pyrophosphorylase family protein